MIEFNGMISKKCIKKTSKRQNKRNGLIVLIPTLFVAVITIFLGIFSPSDFYYFLCWTIIMIIVNIFLFIVPPRSIVFKLPRKLSLDNDTITAEIEVLNGAWKPKIKDIHSVKEVIDEGEWYDIIFKWDTGWWWVCQKNLITKGTIEEFEKLFEGKIRRIHK